MTKNVLISTLLVFACASFASAELLWTGAVSTDIYDIGNWDTTNSSVTGPLAANMTINDDIVVSGAFANFPTIPDQAAQVRFQIGDGVGLTIDNSTWALTDGSNDGLGGDPAGFGPTTVDVINGSSFTSFFIVNHVSLSVDGTSEVTLGGGGNPVNNGAGGPTTINLAPGALLNFTAETPDQFINEHLEQVLVNGQPAIEGTNITISALGAGGSSITAMVPEPSAGVLFSLLLPACLAIARRRRTA